MDSIQDLIPSSPPSSEKLVVGGIIVGGVLLLSQMNKSRKRRRKCPVVISTWRFGSKACDMAGHVLRHPMPDSDQTAVDAVEQAIHQVELDDSIQSFVGYGGFPNECGVMEHDAAMMNGATLDVGAVIALRSIGCPIRVARRVMDNADVNALAGDGALRFALTEGFRKEQTLSDQGRVEWEKWRGESLQLQNNNELNVFAFLSGALPSGGGSGENSLAHSHDSVGVIAMDEKGDICVGVSGSGTAFCPEGRVGDAPFVGSGLYADNAAGAACATGAGDEIMRSCVSFAVVEAMRAGAKPQDACRAVLSRVVAGKETIPQVSVIAMDKFGGVGAATTISAKNPLNQPDATSNPNAFEYAVWRDDETKIHQVTAS